MPVVMRYTERHKACRQVELRLLGAGEIVVPVERGISHLHLIQQRRVIFHERRDPASHADRPLHDVDTAAAGAKLSAQPCTPGIGRQQSEVDLDPGRFLECRRDLLNHRIVPGAIIADVDQLLRLTLCHKDLWRGEYPLQQPKPAIDRGGSVRACVSPLHFMKPQMSAEV